MKKTLIVLWILTWLAGCGKKEKEIANTSPSNKAVADKAPELIVAVGRVEPENEIINLSATAGGIVKAVYKNDGDKVLPNEVLVQLDDDAERSKINEVTAQIQSQRSQIEAEQLQLTEAQLNYDNKSALLAKTKRLLENGAETQQVYDDLVTETKVLAVSVQKAKTAIQLSTGKLNELMAALKTAEIEAQKKMFKAPDAGTLLDMQLAKGEAINQFTTFAEFAPSGNLVVRAEVDELFSSQVKLGQLVDIVFTGNDTVIGTGTITRVSPYLKKKSLFSENTSDQEDRRVREVLIGLSNPGNLIINSKVECKIKL